MIPIRVAIIAKRELSREGLACLLAGDPEIEVVGKFSSRTQALEAMASVAPDVVIFAAQPPREPFNKIAAKLGQLPHAIRFIVLTDSTDQQAIYRFFRMGARAYLTREVTVEHLLAAVKRVHTGEVIIEASIAELVLREISFAVNMEDPSAAPLEVSLSKRELEVLSLAARGSSNKTIADILGVTEHTVKAHMSRIMDKFQARNRQQAVALAIEKGLLPPLL
jgi:DNA-binding NarL/FixJ family response regulator